VSYLPRFYMAQDRVDCPWESKGAVMRTLNHRFRGDHVETIDGLKIHLSDGEWVHVAPNPERPYFELRAEAKDIDRATDLVVEYSKQLKEIIDHH
jgi:mannose-1-phosphate guanylyltransferase/phosphomannomutase